MSTERFAEPRLGEPQAESALPEEQGKARALRSLGALLAWEAGRLLEDAVGGGSLEGRGGAVGARPVTGAGGSSPGQHLGAGHVVRPVPAGPYPAWASGGTLGLGLPSVWRCQMQSFALDVGGGVPGGPGPMTGWTQSALVSAGLSPHPRCFPDWPAPWRRRPHLPKEGWGPRHRPEEDLAAPRPFTCEQDPSR